MTQPLKTITIYDSLTNERRVFVPQIEGKVRMYVCGVTVYDLTHIGHARVFIFFDMFAKFLRRLGYDLLYVRNHTDVDDKIIKRAAELGEEPLALSDRFIDALDEDMGRLGVDKPDVEPRVSTHIDEIISLIQTLIDNEHAYQSGGDVYYRIQRFNSYGSLSNCNLDGMESGRCGRMAPSENENKEHPFDFALWKASKEGEISWDSPWGPGRPGWHIECSAMSLKHLGANFDIHGGGRDLLFPHHENEIAQSEGATGEKFANYWMHVGMVNVVETIDGEVVERKMSKSLGNFWTTRDVLKLYHPEAVRYFMSTTSYRQPISYSPALLDEASGRIEYLYTTLHRIDSALDKSKLTTEEILDNGKFENPSIQKTIELFDDRFDSALADDLNTPKALALISEITKAANDLTQSPKKPNIIRAHTLYRLRDVLVRACNILGFLTGDPIEELIKLRDLRAELLDIDQAKVEQLIQARATARETKDWAEADRIRDTLTEMNIEIMDNPDGSTDWRIKCSL